MLSALKSVFTLHLFIKTLLLVVLKLVCLLVAIAYYTLAERKIMGAIQRRHGPDVVGVWGLLQPLADGLKLLAKELVIPSYANARIFMVAPLAVLTFALLVWSVVPFGVLDQGSKISMTQSVSQLLSVGTSGTYVL